MKNIKEDKNKRNSKKPFILKNFEIGINENLKINESNDSKKGRKKEKTNNKDKYYECKNKKEKTQKGRKKKSTPENKNKKEKIQKYIKRNYTAENKKNKKNQKFSYSIELEPILINKKVNK